MPQQEALIRQLYVRIGGTALETSVMDDLYDVEIDSNLTLPAMAVLRLHDRNAELINNGPFDLGAELVVGVGDPQGRGDQTIFKGEITGIEPEFGDGMVADLVVRAYDRSHRLHRGVYAETYENMSDSDIARQIADAVGLQADVDTSSPTHAHVYQDGQTHMAFLRQRAQRIGYDLYVSDRTLYFKQARANGESPIALEWGVQLRSFRPVLSLAHQVSEVMVRGWDPQQKREVIGQAGQGRTAPSIGENQSGGALAEDAFGNAVDLAVRAAIQSQSEADTLAQARMDEHDGGFVEAEGTCFGQPDLKAGSVVELSALGQRFNGRYKVTSATHVWNTSSDYVTHFRVTGRRTDTLHALLVGDEAPRPRWNAMIALVTNNDDPDGMGRVRVKYPWLNADIESDWARVIGLGAGNQRGFCILPEVNDEVLVVFAQGDVGQPLVVGGLWNGSDTPPAGAGELVANGNVKQRLFVTRTGHKLIFSEENSAAITIETAGGHKILLDDDAAKIEITGSGGNKIVLDENGHKLILESSGEVQIEASTNLTVKANGNMNLEASGNMTIKGALVQLNP